MWLLDVEDFVYTLLLCAFLRQPEITQNIFMYLTIISQSSRGHEQVLRAIDEMMLFAQEKVRFQSILSLLSISQDIETVTNILVFLNVLIQQSESIAVKMAVGIRRRNECRSTPIYSRWATMECRNRCCSDIPQLLKKSPIFIAFLFSRCRKIEKPRCSAE